MTMLYIPNDMVPEGMLYQWARNDIDIIHQMMALGYRPVPYDRHADFFNRRYRRKPNRRIPAKIVVYNNVLMERPILV